MRKYEDPNDFNAAVWKVAEKVTDQDVAEHIRENASGITGRLWLPAVHSERNDDLRAKIIAELGSSTSSGYMSQEHGWSLEYLLDDE